MKPVGREVVNNPLRLLLIDDNPDDRALTMRMLRRDFPYLRVEEIIDAKGFARALEAGGFDLVITDYQLQWTDGVTILRAVKTRWPDRPVIMLTGSGGEEIAVKAIKMGLDDYIVKKITHFVRVPAAVRSALEKASQRQRLKKAEEMLQKSEEKFRLLAENAKDLVYRFVVGEGFEYVNPASTLIVGYTPEEHYADPELGFKVVHPEDRGKLLKLLDDLREHCEPKSTEFRWLHKDGHVVVVEQFNTPIYDEKGHLVAIQGIARDITQRKRSEAEKVKAQAEAAAAKMARDTIEGMMDAVILNNLEGGIIHFNKAWTASFGWGEEAIGKLLTEFVVESDVPRVAEAVKETLDKGYLKNFECTVIAKDKREVPVLVDITLMKDPEGKPTGLIAVVRDITELKRMREALRESEERFRGIAERSFDAIITLDSAGCITYASPAAEKIIGHGPEDFFGKPFRDFLTDSEAPKVVQAFAEVVNGRSVEHLQMEVRKNDGSIVVFEANASPIIRDGEIVGVQGIFRDITERIRMEEFKKLVTIGELATTIAHDIRNPLTSIRNANFYLKNVCPHLVNAENKVAYEMLGTIEREVIAANNIVNDLLDFAGKRPLQKKRRNINRLIEDSLTESKIRENAKVTRNFGKEVIAAVDGKQLGRVFSNLIRNAVQAMPNGGKLTITTGKTKDHIEITFTDTGIGIPKENISKIFQPLFTTKTKGTGFGLPICKKIVEQHDGTIDFRSKIGQGTAFIIKLPRYI